MGYVQLQTSADGTEFLEYTERQTKTRTGAEPKDTRTVKPKLQCSVFSVAGSDRDPVRAFHLYASKRPEQMNSEDSPFYLAVNLTKMANSSKPWFKAAPMGVSKLNLLMKTMAQKAGLNAENISNILSRTTSTRRSLAIAEREDVSLSENQESPQLLSLLQGANIHGGTFIISR